MKLKISLLLLAALPLLAAGVGGSKFRGQVLDIAGVNRLPHAIVTLTSANGHVESVETNQKGEFSFAALTAGDYNFRVTAPGFAIYERDLTVSQGAIPQQLSIRMLAPKDRQTVSVSQLENASARRGD